MPFRLGHVLGTSRPAISGSYINSPASGLWTLTDVETFRRESTWPIQAQVPTAPRSLNYSAGNAQVTLSWVAPTGNGGLPVTGYIAEYSTDADVWTPFNAAVSGRNISITGLTNETLYYFRTTALNAIGPGPYSDTVQATPSELNVDEYYENVALLLHMDPPDNTETADPDSSKVSLLLNLNDFYDASLNTKTINNNSNSVSISSSIKKFGSGSAYFNGNCGCYLTVGDSADFGFGTGDFTIELWIYPLDNNNWRTLFAFNYYYDGLLLRFGNSSDSLYMSKDSNNWSTNWNPSNQVNLNQWNHVALVRNNGTVTCYINGVSSLSTSGGNAGIDLKSSRSLYIGGSPWTGGCENFYGYMDDIRITKGLARYTSNFSVPTAPFAVDHNIYDSSAYNRQLLVNNVVLTNTTSQFGDSSASFTPPSYIRSPGGKIWQLGIDDFTVESWIKPLSLTGDKTIVGNYDGSSGGWRLAVKNPAGGTPVYGTEVSFTKINDPNGNTDIIIPGALEITRDYAGGIYNRAVENYFDYYTSPTNTVWNIQGWNNICNYTTRTYGSLRDTVGRLGNNIVNAELIMKYTPTNRYWLVKFSYWQAGGGGGFSYTRKEILNCITDYSIVQFRNGDGSVVERNTPAVIPTGSWSHVAAVRSSGSLKLFYNGTQLGSDATFTDNITRNNSYGLSIGSTILSNGSTSSYFNGYLDDLRITQNIARYTTDFVLPTTPFANLGPAATPPSAPFNIGVNERNGVFNPYWTNPLLAGHAAVTGYNIQYSSDDGNSWVSSNAITDPYYSNVVLLLPMNGENNSFNFYDESKYNRNILVYGDTIISTTQSKFGGSSGFFNGNNTSILAIPGSSDFNFGAEDFTIDLWVYVNSYNASGGSRLFQTRNGDLHSSISISIGTTGQLGVYASSSGNSWDVLSWGLSTIPLNTWTHIAVSRYNDVFYVFVNGSIVNTASNISSLYFNSNDTIIIGGQSNDYNRSLIGYINDLRVTKGVARYTANFNAGELTQAPANRVSGLTQFTPYIFRASAQNSAGSGPYSSPTTALSTLGPVTNLTVIPDDQQAFLSWVAPSGNNSAISDYSIQYSSDNGSTWTTYENSSMTNTYANITGLTNGVDYVFRVAAINFAGTGTYSVNSNLTTVNQRLDNNYNKTRLILHLDSN